MERAALATALLLCAALPVSAQSKAKSKAPDSWTGNVNLFLGAKALDENDWAPVDSQTEVGLQFDFRQHSWPVNIALDFLASDTTEPDFDPTLGGDIEWYGETTEINLGVRKYWELDGGVCPFIGGGFCFVDYVYELSTSSVTVTESGAGVGVWIDFGLTIVLGGAFNVGFEGKISTADADSELVGTVDAGGGHFGFVLGFHF